MSEIKRYFVNTYDLTEGNTKALYEPKEVCIYNDIKDNLEELKQLRQDCEDMMGSLCTQFERCNNCDHLHDVNVICQSCRHDNSAEDNNTT